MPWPYAFRLVSAWLLPFQRIVMFLLTGKSELERIIANRTLPFALRVHQIDRSLGFTSTKSLDQEIEQAKQVKKKSVIYDQLNTVVHKLDLYQRLIQQTDRIKTTKVTSTEEDHLQLFENIWSRLINQSNDDREQMNMISKRWTKIGFQGSNPLTDFRGMGLLGLQCIERLSHDRTTCLTYVNLRPPNDYSFAIGVINVVSWLVYLLELDPSMDDHCHPLLTHFSLHPCNLDEFFRLFLLVFQEWHEFWIAQKANIMQFEQLSKGFRAQLLTECRQWRAIQRGFSTQISQKL